MTDVSKTAPLDTAEGQLDENSLNAIRSILTEESPPVSRLPFSRAKADPVAPPVQAPPQRSKAAELPVLERPIADPEVEESPSRFGGLKSMLRRAPRAEKPETQRAMPPQTAPSQDGIVAQIKGYRPKPAHIALAAVVLLVVMRPWLVLGLTFLLLFVMIGVFLFAGYDGFWQGVIKVSRWYAKRRPERAAIVHARLDRFAVRWDAILDRFPEGTVDALYLPDFGDLATADKRHAEAMERRLSGLQGKGA